MIVKKEIHFATKGDIKRALILKQSFYLLLSRETSLSIATIPTFETLPPKVQELLNEFGDIFPKEIPPRIPFLRGIEHQIDLDPGASLPNRTAYRTNPQETKELESQVKELLEKRWVQESLGPCAVLVLLVPKKDGKWRMCTDCRAINNITISIGTPFLDLMSCMMPTSFQKLILKVVITKPGLKRVMSGKPLSRPSLVCMNG